MEELNRVLLTNCSNRFRYQCIVQSAMPAKLDLGRPCCSTARGLYYNSGIDYFDIAGTGSIICFYRANASIYYGSRVKLTIYSN